MNKYAKYLKTQMKLMKLLLDQAIKMVIDFDDTKALFNCGFI
jgi:hypothetical protein